MPKQRQLPKWLIKRIISQEITKKVTVHGRFVFRVYILQGTLYIAYLMMRC
jgi:hypothetical protein